MNIGLSGSDPGDTNYIRELFYRSNLNYNFYSMNFKGYPKVEFSKLNNISSIFFLNKNEFISFLNSKKIDLIILGLGHLKKKLNIDIIQICKKFHIKVIVIADSFSNFARRIKKSSDIVLPDKYVVSDYLARKIAIKEGIPSNIIKVGGNPVIFEALKNYKIELDINNAIFISDPLSRNLVKREFKKTLPHNKINEIDIFNFLFSSISKIKKIKKKFFICHPKHDFSKIKKEIYKIDKNIIIIKPDSKIKLQLINKSKFVFGIGSIMLLTARLLNKNVTAILTNKMLKKNDFHLIKYKDIKIGIYKNSINLINQIEKSFKMINISKSKKRYYPNTSWIKN